MGKHKLKPPPNGKPVIQAQIPAPQTTLFATAITVNKLPDVELPGVEPLDMAQIVVQSGDYITVVMMPLAQAAILAESLRGLNSDVALPTDAETAILAGVRTKPV